MKLHPPAFQSVLILPLLAALASPLAGQNSPISQVQAEIARLQQSLKEKPISDPDLNSLAPMIDDSLKSARDAAQAGQLYLSLEKLG